jgi:hypothetical protein
MPKILKMSLLSVCILLLSTLPALASLEWSVGPAIPLDDEAIDSAESPDGSRLFILTRSGKVLVLNRSGNVEASIKGPFNAENLSVSNDGKRLYLTGKGEKQLQVVSLLDRFTIPIGGSPVKGDIAAAVTVAVFSDFQ